MKTGGELLEEISRTSGPAFWWLGQMGFAVKLGGKVLYFDPFLAAHPKRRIPPLLDPAQIANADYVLGSHNHIDHIDSGTWRAIAAASPKARFILPQALLETPGFEPGVRRERLIGLDDGAVFEEDGIRITGVASAHEFLDRDPATGRCPYLGYVAEDGRHAVYHAGDTCVYDGLRARLAHWKLDVMFLPINGRDGKRYRENIIGNMTWQEAVDLAGALRPALAVPGHYEMFEHNSEDPRLFADYLGAKYPDRRCWIGEHGMRVDF